MSFSIIDNLIMANRIGDNFYNETRQNLNSNQFHERANSGSKALII